MSDTVTAVSLIITTVNVNGVRAAAGKGLLDWLAGTAADIVCLQEVRATEQQFHAAIAPVLEAGWHCVGAESSAKGRAGVAILSRIPRRRGARGIRRGGVRCCGPVHRGGLR